MTDYLTIAHIASDAACYGVACVDGIRHGIRVDAVVTLARLAARCANRIHYLAAASWPDDHADASTAYLKGELNATRGKAFATVARAASTTAVRPLRATTPTACVDLSSLSSTPALRKRFGHLVTGV